MNNPNEDTSKASYYHNGTNHWYDLETNKFDGGELLKYKPFEFDINNRPHLFKKYQEDLDLMDLTIPEEFEELDAMKSLENNIEQQERFLYLESLSKILHYSAGVTKTIVRRKKPIKFRAASCTGALYHIEIYVITARLPGLGAGIYHYDSEGNQLQLIRKGDFRQAIMVSSGDNFVVEDSPVILAYTSAFWRNAVKYRARAYRHAFWDSGVVLSNSLAMARSLDLNASVLLGFVDKGISRILALDEKEEIPLALLTLGYSAHNEVESPTMIELSLPTVAYEQKVEWIAINDIHKASSLSNPSEVKNWRDFSITLDKNIISNDVVLLRPQATRKMKTMPLEKIISRRGSTRKFNHNSITLQQFSNLMKMGTSIIPADFYNESVLRYNQIYAIINAVDDIPSGSYYFDPETMQLEPIKLGFMREKSKKLGLGQDLAHDAAALVFFLVDLDTMLNSFGNRGYRVAQMEASIWGGKMYLAAYAQGFGATGLTFVDTAVPIFFEEEKKIITFMMCFGHKK